MQFQGSKRRFFKYIFPFMEQRLNPGDYVVDLFMGGANFIQYVPNTYNRIANDRYSAYFAIQAVTKYIDSIPKNKHELTREQYNKIRSTNYTDITDKCVKEYVGFFCSFSGKKWGGYAGIHMPSAPNRDKIAEQYRAALIANKMLSGVEFYNLDYRDVPLPLPDQCVIYCDIPYKNTSQSYSPDEFDYESFYQWCYDKHNEGYTIFVSEYSMPDGFSCIWTMKTKNQIQPHGRYSDRIEKLWVVKT